MILIELLFLEGGSEIRPFLNLKGSNVENGLAKPIYRLQVHYGFVEIDKISFGNIRATLNPLKAIAHENLTNLSICRVIRNAIELFKQFYLHVKTEGISVHAVFLNMSAASQKMSPFSIRTTRTVPRQLLFSTSIIWPFAQSG